jgi:hypothetical protein
MEQDWVEAEADRGALRIPRIAGPGFRFKLSDEFHDT